jgi:hypothetical protein
MRIHTYEIFNAVLNEGVFDKYASELAVSYKKELSMLNPILNEYQKLKLSSMDQRIKIDADIAAETDGARREKLNNDLVRVNKDEETKRLLIEKKLAKWAEAATAPVKYLMTSRLAEIDLSVLQDEFKKKMSVKGSMTDNNKKRYMDMIKLKQEALKVRAEKLQKMIANEDTRSEDKELEKNKQNTDEVESDFDASGQVTSQEKVAIKQRAEREKNSPLNKI